MIKEAELSRRIQAALTWGEEASRQLLGAHVDVKFTEEGFGFTSPNLRPGSNVSVHVNAQIATADRGEELLSAVLLHELGHHWAHFGDRDWERAAAASKAAGQFELFNLILDEHMERRLRSEDTTWGKMLDRLVAHVFGSGSLLLTPAEYAHLRGLPVDALIDGVRSGRIPGTLVYQRGVRLQGLRGGWVALSDFPVFLFGEVVAEPPYPETMRTFLGKEYFEELRSMGLLVAEEFIDSWKRITWDDLISVLEELDFFSENPDRVRVDFRDGLASILSPRQHEKEEHLPGSSLEDTPGRARYLNRISQELGPFLDSEWTTRVGEWLRAVQAIRNNFWAEVENLVDRFRRGEFPALLGKAPHWWMPVADRLSHLQEILGIESSATPRQALDSLLREWKPESEASEEVPEFIRVPWLQVAKSPGTPIDAKFAVALRLGMGPRAFPDAPLVSQALSLIPKNLRQLTVSEIQKLSDRVWQCLGLVAIKDLGLREPLGNVDDDPSSFDADRLRRKIFGALGSFVDKGEVPELSPDTIKRAIADAKEVVGTRPEPWNRYDEFEKGVTGHPRDVRPPSAPGFDALNLGKELEFELIHNVETIPPNVEGYREIADRIRPLAREMRRSFEAAGIIEVEESGHRTGTRTDPARLRRLATLGDPGILIRPDEIPGPRFFLGIALDASGSMWNGLGSEDETRIEVAKAFGVLILEAARYLQGITTRVIAFTDAVIYDLGKAGDTSVASLEAGGGNNDSAGLAHLAGLALSARHDRTLLVMISDGFPTECTLSSLKELVQVLGRFEGVELAQVALDGMDEHRVAFPAFVDLSKVGFEVAVKEFGDLVRRLMASEPIP